MKKITCFFFSLILLIQVQSQTLKTPDVIWGKLFEEVQLKRIFPDNKTFVDAVPKYAPEIILKKYETAKSTDTAFNLKAFIIEHFNIPQTPSVKVEEGLALKAHLEELWETLQRKKDVRDTNSSLLPLPKPYIVPGGRFPGNLLLGQLFYYVGFSGKQAV